MTKFRESLAKLKAAVGRCDLVGKWSKNSENGFYSFRAETDEILNWWPSTGTIQFQGKNHEKFKRRLSRSVGKASTADKMIFVVDGGGSEVGDELEMVLRRLGLGQCLTENSESSGTTIIHALEQRIHKEGAFGIVLVTLDNLKDDERKGDEEPLRAPQNVVFEMGMMAASLGRGRMIVLKKGKIGLPSAADEIVCLKFKDHVKETAPKLAKHLKRAGFKITPHKKAEKKKR
jgi:predicted nucleotide-binding protein